MLKRTVFFVSDQTGITAETMGHSLMTQFDGIEFRQVTVPFIATVDKAIEAVRKIDLVAKQEGVRPIVFSTLVQEDVRNVVRGSTGFFLDFFDPFLAPLENELKTQSHHVPSRTHRMADGHAYAMRIDATNFALANDDGSVVRDYERADIILVGVSRSGKTPTCLYLAMQYGIFAANYPLTDDDLESRNLPGALEQHAQKLFGLTIKADRLQQIRNERRPDSRYSSINQVAFEVRAAESLFERNGIRSSTRPNARSRKFPAVFSTAPGSSGGSDLETAWYSQIMIADQWCETSWRAQPGSFVGLMTLYESNFVRLRWLVRDLRAVTCGRVSHSATDCDLYLTPLESSRYTSVFRLTYEFGGASDSIRDPDLEVCVYHDARLAEVRSFRGFHRHPQLSKLQSVLKRELDQRWSRNMMLNKWLEYCAEQGHHF